MEKSHYSPVITMITVVIDTLTVINLNLWSWFYDHASYTRIRTKLLVQNLYIDAFRPSVFMRNSGSWYDDHIHMAYYCCAICHQRRAGIHQRQFISQNLRECVLYDDHSNDSFR